MTLTTATNGGGFTYASATNITIHANVTAGTTACLVVSGSTGGGTVSGNVTGGSSSAAVGLSVGQNSVALALIGNVTGGSGSTAYGVLQNGSGALNITGNLTPGTVHGLYVSNSSSNSNITGNCYGSNTTGNAFGCNNGGGVMTVTGNLIWGTKTGALNSGGTATYYTPGATNYILYPKDSSYTLGTINSHAIEMPMDPGVGNVKSGTVYGSFTGTLASGGIYAFPVH